MKSRIAPSLILSALLFCAGAQANIIYSDNFSSDTPALNEAPSGWTIGNGGTVDIIAPVNEWGLKCESASSTCIDLDGSSYKSGLLSSPNMALNQGDIYTVMFELAGNQRLNQTDIVTVTFGGATVILDLAENAPWTTYSISAIPTKNETTNLTFLDSSNNDVGALLGDVSVDPASAAIPEPGTCALLGLGLLVATLVRRKGISAR